MTTTTSPAPFSFFFNMSKRELLVACKGNPTFAGYSKHSRAGKAALAAFCQEMATNATMPTEHVATADISDDITVTVSADPEIVVTVLADPEQAVADLAPTPISELLRYCFLAIVGFLWLAGAVTVAAFRAAVTTSHAVYRFGERCGAWWRSREPLYARLAEQYVFALAGM